MKAALSLRDDIGELPRLLAFACDFGRDSGIAPGEISRVLVILDEVFSNIVRHGYEPPGGRGTIVVQLALAAQRLGIEITDDARPFNPLAAAQPDLDLPAAQRPIGGLGIHLVRSLTDVAHYARDGQRNRLVLSRCLPAAGSG